MHTPCPDTDTATSLCVRDMTVRVRDGRTVRTVLDIPALDLPSGAIIGIHGPSGSGKTSLLRVLSGLRLPDSGSVHWGDTDITRLPGAARDSWRGHTIGFVFQNFRLFPTLSAADNVLVPATFHHTCIPDALRTRAHNLLEQFGLTSGPQHVATLSRGEQQRVAVARALLFAPRLLLADEPTASLDVDNARTVMDALLGYAAATGATACVVSHDVCVLDRLAQHLRLERGRLVEPAEHENVTCMLQKNAESQTTRNRHESSADSYR